MELWCPFAVRDEIPGHPGARSFSGGGWKIVHHTTEGDSYAGARATYARTGDLPHFTDSFEDGTYRAWQHLPINVAATALRHPMGTGPTNTDNAIQIEHVGFTAHAADFPDAYLLGIAILSRWIEVTVGVSRTAVGFEFPRMAWRDWHAYSGHCGHMHVPANDHHDPGRLDMARILMAGQPQPQPAPPVVIATGTIGGQPVKTIIVTVPTDANGDGSAPAPPGFLAVSAAGSHDKYDPNAHDTDTIVVPVGARPSGAGVRLVVENGPRSTTVGAPVLISD